MADELERIRWAGKVPIAKIAKLYGDDAQGLYDEELVRDIGWRLLARCESVMTASASRVDCPRCGTQFEVRWVGVDHDDAVECPGRDWAVTPSQFHKSFEHQDLLGGPVGNAFAEYVERYPKAETYAERLLLIDRLVHAVHVSGNTACRNLFEGRHPWKLVRMLDAISGSAGGTSVLAHVQRGS